MTLPHHCQNNNKTDLFINMNKANIDFTLQSFTQDVKREINAVKENLNITMNDIKEKQFGITNTVHKQGEKSTIQKKN